MSFLDLNVPFFDNEVDAKFHINALRECEFLEFRFDWRVKETHCSSNVVLDGWTTIAYNVNVAGSKISQLVMQDFF